MGIFASVFASFGKCLFHTHPGCLPLLFSPGRLFRGCCLRGGNRAFGCTVGTCVSLAGGAQRWLWHLLYLARMPFVCLLVFYHLLPSTQTVPKRPPVSTWVFLCQHPPWYPVLTDFRPICRWCASQQPSWVLIFGAWGFIRDKTGRPQFLEKQLGVKLGDTFLALFICCGWWPCRPN